ncbi:mechanosensitive ion channel family protein [Aureibaculum marinum]|uniref:Mechanosensitive ion channel family protein n=1 Tax=Aureibaculum marinum TaxID=2487930 RepID=A0A3N4NWW3_9FLAO|nr:mechanosensitive ion channel family protein [Aureibaculum marinum]RPD98748.1 mechanosensitive ion channel family protein [Aureibaculum marinum]
MFTLEAIKNWIEANPSYYIFFKYVVWVLFVVIMIQLIRRLLRRKILDSDARYKSQKAIEIIGYVFLIVLSIAYFTGSIKDFTLAIGLFSAGIAFALQELFLSIAGSIYIFLIKVYKPGDRIELHKIKGDVIDIDSVYTTMMEIGEWVGSDNYTGRIVKISNAFVFKGPIYNYSKDFPFIWDEFNLPIKYGSDIEMVKSIITRIAIETLSEYTKLSKATWKEVVNKYYIEDAQVNPTLAITLTDNWIQLNLRYIVDYKKRRCTKNLLNEKINSEIKNTNGKVMLASTTLEIINLPEINLTSK